MLTFDVCIVLAGDGCFSPFNDSQQSAQDDVPDEVCDDSNVSYVESSDESSDEEHEDEEHEEDEWHEVNRASVPDIGCQ